MRDRQTDGQTRASGKYDSEREIPFFRTAIQGTVPHCGLAMHLYLDGVSERRREGQSDWVVCVRERERDFEREKIE